VIRARIPCLRARKIPIGVFDPVFNHLSLDQMIEKISALGIEAVEMGTGATLALLIGPARSYSPITLSCTLGKEI